MSLPFVLLHQCIRLRPKSFVQLPVRFIPVAGGAFAFTMHAAVHPMPAGQEGDNKGAVADGAAAAAAAAAAEAAAAAAPSSRCNSNAASYGTMVELRGEGRAM